MSSKERADRASTHSNESILPRTSSSKGLIVHLLAISLSLNGKSAFTNHSGQYVSRITVTYNEFQNKDLFTYLLTYSLTLWSTVLLEKLKGFQLVKKFPALYVTQRFITAFTNARHLSLSGASSIQSTPPHPTSWRSILTLSSHLRLGLPGGLFPSGFSWQRRRICHKQLNLFKVGVRHFRA